MLSLVKLKRISAIQNALAAMVCGMVIVLADALAWFAVYLVLAPSNQMAATKFVIMAAAWGAWSAMVHRQYSRRHSFWTELGIVLQGILMLAFVGSMLKAIIGNSDNLRAWWLACFLLFFALPIFRWLARALLRRCGLWIWPTLVFGGGDNARQAVLALRDEAAMGYAVAGVVLQKCGVMGEDFRELGCSLLPWPESTHDFESLHGYHCVIALEAHEFELRDRLIRQLSQHRANHVHVIPAMRGVPLFGLASTSFFSHEVLMIHVRNNLCNPMHRWIKRLFDLVTASILVVALSPLMLWVAYKIWRSDGTPIIFSQSRVGKGLESFKFYKFRSMKKNAEDMLKNWEAANSSEWREYIANNFKLSNDPRLISVGALIRRTSIDELPQLFNVIKGDMSLVGPRPLLLRELGEYGDDLCLYAQTPPGLTGLWQISGRSQTTFDDRVAFDAWYVKNWSIWTDITILFKTISVVSGGRGAY